LYTFLSLSENMKHFLSTVQSPLFFQPIELNPPHNMSFLVLNNTNRGPLLSHKEWNTDTDIPSRVPLRSSFANICYFPRASWILVIRNLMLSALSINIDSVINFYLISYIIFSSSCLMILFYISSWRIVLSSTILAIFIN
jgi:hypothetical protein